MRCVNLIPAPRRDRIRRKRTVRRWAGGSVVYASMLLGVYLLCSAAWGSGSLPVSGQLDQTGRRINVTREAIEKLESRLGRVKAKLSANESVGNQPDWGLVLALVGRKTGPYVVLRRCDLLPIGEPDEKGRPKPVDVTTLAPQRAGGLEGGYRLSLEGVGRDQTAVWRFVLGLEKLGLFDEVKMVNSQGEAFNGKRAVGFHVQCELLAGGDE